jgi:sigma-B regulation protein RsbU (phosphoserine phosphatase)
MSPSADTHTRRHQLPDTSLFARPSHSGRRSVLVVDDDTTLRTVMCMGLQQAGYEVYSAEDGLAAFDLLQRMVGEKASLDAMLLDLHMPGLDGIGLLDRMLSVGMVLPVIACTGDYTREMVIELMRRGVGDIIDKPIRLEDLVRTVGAFIERADRLAERRRDRERKLKAEAERLEQEHAQQRRKAQEASDSFSRLAAQVKSARAAWRDLVGTLTPPNGLGLSYRIKPLADMGGDFIGLHLTEQGCVILMADVAGHDLGASLHTVLIKAFFEENCRRGLGGDGMDGQSLLALLNRQLLKSSDQRRLVTAQLVTFDLKAGMVTVDGAGHPPCLYQRGALIEPLAGGGSILGIANEVFFNSDRRPWSPKDRLWLLTDGISDLPRVDGRMGDRRRIGIDGVIKHLRDIEYMPLGATVTRLWDLLLQWCRRKAVDDMLLVGLEAMTPGDDYEPSDGATTRLGLTSLAGNPDID